jgi:hypothetical protein
VISFEIPDSSPNKYNVDSDTWPSKTQGIKLDIVHANKKQKTTNTG